VCIAISSMLPLLENYSSFIHLVAQRILTNTFENTRDLSYQYNTFSAFYKKSEKRDIFYVISIT